MFNLNRQIERNLYWDQNRTYYWWPIELRATQDQPVGWINLPGGLSISFGIEVDFNERLIAQIGPVSLTRLETEDEERDREDAEIEEACMRQDASYYTAWYY